MTAEQTNESRPFRQAITLTVPNVISAILDSPFLRLKISTGTLAEDGKTVTTKRGAIEVNRADAQPGQKVVVYET